MSPLAGLSPSGEQRMVVDTSLADAQQVLTAAVAEVRTLVETRARWPQLPGQRRF